jgi:hypothetical protein
MLSSLSQPTVGGGEGAIIVCTAWKAQRPIVLKTGVSGFRAGLAGEGQEGSLCWEQALRSRQRSCWGCKHLHRTQRVAAQLM